MGKIITIFDGDSIAFRASAVTTKRSVDILHKSSGRIKNFNTRTEFKELLEEKGKVFNKDDYEFTDKQEAEPVANCLSILKHQINSINSALFADEYLICLSGKKNFRDRLPLPSKYKGSREGVMRPPHLVEAKTYLWKNHPSLLAKDREADDDLIVKGYEYLRKGYTPILVSQDKDAYSASGLFLYDYTQNSPDIIEVPKFGSLWDTGKKITGNGFIWLCFQLINGDSADDYKPSELQGEPYGEKSAFKLLKDCKTETEALEKVIDQYKRWYPEPVDYTDWSGVRHVVDYKDLIGLYFKCAKMMEHDKDPLDAIEFFARYGVKL